jgi:hypothetical protein
MNKDVSDELSEFSTCNDEGLSYIERQLALRSRPASQQPLPSLPASKRRSLGRQVLYNSLLLFNKTKWHSIVVRAQCFRSWGKVGLYKPSIQFDLLSENWRDVVTTLVLED